jgi:hypothetical protein
MGGWPSIGVTTNSGMTTLLVKQMLPYRPDVINAFDPLDNMGRILRHNAYEPLFKVPAAILSADPAWKNCDLKLYQKATSLIPLGAQVTSEISQRETSTETVGTALPKSAVTPPLPQRTRGIQL